MNFGLEYWGSDQMGVNKTRRFLLEWLSFTCRYIPVGVLEVLPQRINEKPPPFVSFIVWVVSSDLGFTPLLGLSSVQVRFGFDSTWKSGLIRLSLSFRSRGFRVRLLYGFRFQVRAGDS